MLLLSLVFACTGTTPAPEEPVVEAAAEVAVAQPTTLSEGSRGGQATPVATVPTYVQPVRALLLARHAEDLPSKETLDAHDQAQDALIWLALNEQEMVVRERALLLLANYPDDVTRAALVQVLEGDFHDKLKAAAIYGAAGFDLDADAELKALIEAQQASEDPRIQAACAEVLSPEAQP